MAKIGLIKVFIYKTLRISQIRRILSVLILTEQYIYCKDTGEYIPRCPYSLYTDSYHWKKKRKEYMSSNYFHGCYLCYVKKKIKNYKNIEVHHVNYNTLGNERLNDLISLCRKCHNRIHRLAKKHLPVRICNFTFLKETTENPYWCLKI